MSEPQDLLDQLRHGDEQAMRKVYLDCGKKFRKWAGRQFSGLPLADRLDAWHDAFYTFLVNLSQGKVKVLVAGICTYLTAIGKNTLLKRNTHRRRIEPLDDHPANAGSIHPPGELTEEERADLVRRLREAVGALSPQKRRIVELRYIQGKSIAEIREIIGYVSDNAVSVTLSRALQEIRDKLKDKSSGTT